MTREQAESCTILRGIVGSRVHGLHIEDGLEDRDEMGVCVEPIEAAMGVHAPFEQFIYRSAAEREGRHDAPSQGGDLDLTIYSLRKYVRLALKGNPTILLLLFAPSSALVVREARGMSLRGLAPSIISRQAGRAFLGYLQAQRQRMLGERGNGGHGRPRAALTEQFGFDTKYAMHMCRLALQGVELMKTGSLQLPIAEPDRSWLFDVRIGKVDQQEVLTRTGEAERELKDLIDTAPIREYPDVAAVDDWVTTIYIRAWMADRTTRDIAEDRAAYEARQARVAVAVAATEYPRVEDTSRTLEPLSFGAVVQALGATAVPTRCPTCSSPDPSQHPATGVDGLVRGCADGWHRTSTIVRAR
jgi:predicted nucleotidyltransferase